MGIKRHKSEEIVQKLRQVDVLVEQGTVRIDAIRQMRIAEGSLDPIHIKKKQPKPPQGSRPPKKNSPTS